MDNTDYLFRPLTREQEELAEKLTANLESNFFVEKRDDETRIHPGILIPFDPDGKPYKVMVTDARDAEGDRILITSNEFDKIVPAELICEFKSGEKIRIKGEAEATRPGRREDDRTHQPPLNISFFHPTRREE